MRDHFHDNSKFRFEWTLRLTNDTNSIHNHLINKLHPFNSQSNQLINYFGKFQNASFFLPACMRPSPTFAGDQVFVQWTPVWISTSTPSNDDWSAACRTVHFSKSRKSFSNALDPSQTVHFINLINSSIAQNGHRLLFYWQNKKMTKKTSKLVFLVPNFFGDVDVNIDDG